MPKDPFEPLREDHRKVAALFEKIEATTERAEKGREKLFAELKELLESHSELEESRVYPVLEEPESTHDLSLEAEEEHRVVKLLLTELGEEDHTTEQWTAKFTVLKENVEHHVKEEEEELFPKALKALGEEALRHLREEINSAKQNEA